MTQFTDSDESSFDSLTQTELAQDGDTRYVEGTDPHGTDPDSVDPDGEHPDVRPDNPPQSTSSTPAVVKEFSPYVYLYPGEKYYPESAKSFLSNAELQFHNGQCPDSQDITRNSWDAFLGSGEYTGYEYLLETDPDASYLSVCANAASYKTNWYDLSTKADTRPDDDASDGPRGSDGFDLKVESNGALTGWKSKKPKTPADGTLSTQVYYTYKAKHYITYFFLYGDNQRLVDKHEGDWEYITVVLNHKNNPISVNYSHHGTSCSLSWGNVAHPVPLYVGPSNGQKTTHPVIYSAEGGHASWPVGAIPDDYKFVITLPGLKDKVGSGVEWRTQAHLMNAVDQSWWGYTGAWGKLGHFNGTTGPSGPSPLKYGSFDFVKQCNMG